MTNRFDLLISSINASNLFMVKMFLFAVFAILGYGALGWNPPAIRRPTQMIYLGLALLGFVLVTVYSATL